MKNSTIKWILIGLIVVAAIYVIVDHGQHIAPYLPFAFLLGCLFMHLVGHGGHHSRHDHEGSEQSK